MNATIIQSALCKTKVFPRPSPTIFFFPGLNTAPVFQNKALHFTDLLRDKTTIIRDEYLKLRSNVFTHNYDTGEHKLLKGSWEWNSYIDKGKINSDFAVNCPETTSILESLQYPTLMKNTPFSFAFFSTLKTNSSIAAHYGPSNIRIRCHLPLIVPEGDCGFKIGGNEIKWQVGEPLFFDDCYEHSAWNHTQQDRVVLLFDLWHPELTLEEINAIVDMFGYAREQGWMKH